MLAIFRSRASSAGSKRLPLERLLERLREDRDRLRELFLRCARSKPSKEGFESLLSSPKLSFRPEADVLLLPTKDPLLEKEPLGEMEIMDA